MRNPIHTSLRARRWAHASSHGERSAYAGPLREMQDFEYGVLRGADKRGWPISVTLPLLLARSRSAVALAAAYYANQVAIRLLPRRSSTRR